MHNIDYYGFIHDLDCGQAKNILGFKYGNDECMKIHSCIIFAIVSVFFIPMVIPMLRCSFMFLILGKLRIFFL